MKKWLKSMIGIIVVLLILISLWTYFDKPEYANVDKVKPYKGNTEAKITLTEFSDLQCPACRAMEPTVKQVLVDYEGKIRLEYKQFPLESIHQFAFGAAQASECANDQDEFWTFVDKAFANQNDLTIKSMIRYAEEIGMDTKKFSDCLKSGAKIPKVREEQALGRELGVSGTPAFFVNGAKVNTNSYDALKAAIDSALNSTIQ